MKEEFESCTKIANDIYEIAGVYPSGWSAVNERTIEWLGYEISMNFSALGEGHYYRIHGLEENSTGGGLFSKPQPQSIRMSYAFHDAGSLLEAMEALQPLQPQYQK